MSIRPLKKKILFTKGFLFFLKGTTLVHTSIRTQTAYGNYTDTRILHGH